MNRSLCVGSIKANNQGDPLVADDNGGLYILVVHRHQVAPPPNVVALTLNELAWRFTRLTFQLSLLITNPDQLGYCIGTRHFKACVGWGSKGHTSVRWVGCCNTWAATRSHRARVF
jgi:hypothetical protein